MRDILAHRIDHVETFSTLSTMSFKTEGHAISSILIHEITSQAGKAESEDALADLICDILSQQWNRCLKEELVHSFKISLTKYTPLMYIQSLLNYLLLRNYSTCKHCLILHPSPIHLSQSTIQLHASKRIYNKETPQIPYKTITNSLEILYTIACGLATSDEVDHFWKILSVNFVVMTLHSKQFVGTILGMSQLLEISVTSDGFGPRGSWSFDGDDDGGGGGGERDSVSMVLEKLTLNLIEEPRIGCPKEDVLVPFVFKVYESFGGYDRLLWRRCRNLLLEILKDLKFYMTLDTCYPV